MYYNNIFSLSRLTTVLRAKNLGSSTRAAIVFRVVAAVSIAVMALLFLGFTVAQYVMRLEGDFDLSSTFGLIAVAMILLFALGLTAGSSYFLHQVMQWSRELMGETPLMKRVFNKSIWIIVTFVGVWLFFSVSVAASFIIMTPENWLSTFPSFFCFDLSN